MEATIENSTVVEASYPSLVRRVQSIFIDTLLVIIAMVVISAILSQVQNTPDWIRIALFVFLFFAYEPILMAFTPGTIGNRLMGIQVKQAADETQRPTLWQAYIRFVFKLVLGWLSFVTMHFNVQRRAIHDLVGRTVMIQR
jgi:uncharacterized RDD family membrane protein YckC